MSLVGYPIRRQLQQQNIRTIQKERRQIVTVKVPVDPKFPNGRQRNLTELEILFIQFRRTSGLYSILEQTAATVPIYQAGSPAQALRIMRNTIRTGINLDQNRWVDAEIIDRPYLIQDLKGNKFYVFRVEFAYGEAAAEAAMRAEDPRNGWNKKIKRLEQLATNGPKVKRTLDRYEKDILAGRR